ncbi:ATP-NAD kinase-like domain-containing protein [Chytriomyces sp. MP71]|nr:ATP-NAD kinase-like domain-containing protein [Chytriomyces sp. MP71]
MAPELFRHIVALVGDDRRGAPQPVDLVVTRDAIEWTSCVDGAAANGAGAQTTGGQRRMRSRPSVGLRALLFGAGVAVARRIHPHFVFAAHEQSNAIVMHYLATPPTSTAPVVNADVLALPHSTSRPLRLSTTFALPSSAVVTALLDALHSVGVPVTQDPAASHRVLCRVRKPLLIFVNPYGGVKDAPTIFKNTVAPMLALAGVPFEQLDTQYKGHAEDVVRSADMNAYSGIIAVSGDGILHEICNGMMTRRDWRRARLVPVGTIGAGSSNAMNRNLGHMFPEYGVLSIIKETTQPTDLLSTTFHESKKVVYSHLSMSWAYIADVDIEQDKYRWMGREKTTFCALLRLFRLRKYRGHIGIQPFEANSSVAQAALEADMNEITKLDPEATDAMDTMQSYGPARSLKNTTVSDTSVYPIQMTPANDPISYFMANNVPWIASDVKGILLFIIICSVFDILFISLTTSLPRCFHGWRVPPYGLWRKQTEPPHHAWILAQRGPS